MSAIMVTGGAGYIGSHAVLGLLEAGYEVVVLDNLSTGHRDVVPNDPRVELVVGDVADRSLLADIFSRTKIDAVMHFSAHCYVGESVFQPLKYYSNNVSNTLVLLESMLAAGVSRVVFSSSCATFGNGTGEPIHEGMTQSPTNPYGETKLVVERMLRDFDRAYGLKSVILRYFNAAGADPQLRSGEDHDPETHIIPLLIQAAAGVRDEVSVYGTDYATPDGTCIRDYVHVSDLARAHLLALQFLQTHGRSEHFNLGNGRGFSVREVISTVERVTESKVNIREVGRRPGDPALLVADATKARALLGWEPRFSNIETMVEHAFRWQQQLTARKAASTKFGD